MEPPCYMWGFKMCASHGRPEIPRSKEPPPLPRDTIGPWTSFCRVLEGAVSHERGTPVIGPIPTLNEKRYEVGQSYPMKVTVFKMTTDFL